MVPKEYIIILDIYTKSLWSNNGTRQYQYPSITKLNKYINYLDILSWYHEFTTPYYKGRKSHHIDYLLVRFTYL